MDFVSTLRFWEDMQEHYDSLSEEEQREFRGEVLHDVDNIPEGTDDEGFIVPDEIKEKVDKEVIFMV